MRETSTYIICIACSVFQHELEALRAREDFNIPVRYLDSALHIYPDKLKRQLDSILENELKQGKKVVLLYGDCHAYMEKHGSMTDVVRVRGLNCFDILLGQEKYKSLREEGAFFLLPEWTMRWREIFQTRLGLNEDNVKSFMSEMNKKLVYLDTGVVPVPMKHLKAFSEYINLPWEIISISLDNLLAAVSDAIRKLE